MSGEGGQLEVNATAAEIPAAVAVPEAKAPRRTLAASDIAKYTGRQKRIVLTWAAKGCPHSIGIRKKHRSPSFNLQEVKAWLRSRGEPEVVMARGKAGSTTKGDDQAAGPTVFEVSFEERLAKASTEADLRGQIRHANAQLAALMEQKPPMAAQPDWARKWAESFVTASKELRQLEAAAFEADQRKGLWIRKADSEQICAAEALAFNAALQSLRGKLPADLAVAIAELVPADRIDQVRRTIAAVVAAATANLGNAVADAIAEQVRQEAA